MSDIITVTIPELPAAARVDGTEMIAVFKGDRLQRIGQSAIRGTKTFTGATPPPDQPSAVMALDPVLGDRWRNTETGDEWKVTALDPFTWTFDGNLMGAASQIPGPAGARGAAGKDGKDGQRGLPGPGLTVTKVATAPVPDWCAIVANGTDGCKAADPSDLAQRQQVIGITAFGGLTRSQVTAQISGDLLGPNAGFVPGTTLFVGAGGALTSTPPTSGWRQAVASVIADGHIVVNLGEATLIASDVALIDTGGFATKAAPADVAAGSGPGWTDVDQTKAVAQTFGGPAAPFRTVGQDAVTRKFLDKILDFPLTPLDYMSDEQRAAVRAGTNTADTSDAYEACLLAALAYVDAGDNRAVRVREPAGAYVWDRKVKIDLSKTGRTNGMIIEREGRFASKHYMGPNNKYRFVDRGLYNPVSNTPNLLGGGLTPGDCWTVEAGKSDFNYNGVASVNVGDRLYVRANGQLQKILATARYRGYVDLSNGDPVTTFGQAKIDSNNCQYGDTWVVEKAGLYFGTYIYRGQEIFFLDRNTWRVKDILRGAYSYSLGERDFSTAPFPSTAGLGVGNFYVVAGPIGRDYAPSALPENASPELLSIRAGDKVVWTGAAWELIWCSPTPRGCIQPNGLLTSKRWRAASQSFEHNNFPVVANQGGYGDWLYFMGDRNDAFAGVPGPNLEDEVIFFGPSGWEKVLRDPNYDVGMLHFTWDFLDHSVGIIGGWSDISTQKTTDPGSSLPENPYNNGNLYRFWGRHSFVSNNGLFSDENVLFEGGNLTHDDPSAGEAQGSYGLIEKWVYCRNCYLPRISRLMGRMAYGGKREIYNPKYPRVGVAAIHLEDCYVPRILDVNLNARFRIGYWISSQIWDVVDGSSWEGGEFDGGWAELIDGIRMEHGYRKDGAGTEPTFLLKARDTKSLSNGIIINGHCNVIIQGCVPIIEENYKADGTGKSVSPTPAAILLERADNVVINSFIPVGGFSNAILPPGQEADVNPNWRSVGLLLRGPVGTVSVSAGIFAMNGGVGIDATLVERRSVALAFPGYVPPGETLPVRPDAPSIRLTGYTLDGLYNAIVQGQRVLTAVVDPNGVVVTQGINREGGGESAAGVASHAYEHRAHSTTAAYDPIISAERARADFATFQSGRLGKYRIRGRDTGGTWREAFSVTAQWAGNSTPTGGNTLVQFQDWKGGAPFTYMEVNAQTSRMTLYENVVFAAQMLSSAGFVDAVDDVAAAAAGVVLGQFYRSGSTLRVRIS